jgi:glycosyltransferase involved in cell wall biosynthesis
MVASDGHGRDRLLDILMLSCEFPPIGGGGSHVVAGLAHELALRGHRVDVLTMGWGGRSKSDCTPGVRVIEVPALRRRISSAQIWELSLYLPLLLSRAAETFLRRRYDVCHVHFMLPDGVAAWVLRHLFGRHFVVTAHGSDVPGYNPERFLGLHRVLRPVWRRIAHSADAVICPSPTLERLILAEASDTRTIVIPNGFDETRFRADRERLPRILMVSRLFGRKGIHTVLKAFIGLDPPFELHVVGDGPEMAAVSAATTHGRIFAHGWIDNADPRLRELFETASIFAFMSCAENFPVCLLEAMAAGLAIVTSAGTGCADVVGDAGVLVAPGDVDGVRAALARLTTEPAAARALGGAARHRLEHHFTWRTVADHHVRLYREVLLGRKPAVLAVEQQTATRNLAAPDANLWQERGTHFSGRAR